MTKLQMEIPQYDQAMNKFIYSIGNYFLSLDPLLGNMSKTTSSHDGPIRNIRGDDPLDQQPFEITTLSGLHHDYIRTTNLIKHTDFIYEIIQQLIREMSINFFQGIEEITNATGQVYDAKGEPISFDHILDMTEAMPIEFDDQGEPILPRLIIPPQLSESVKRIQPTQEQKKREAEIIAKKKEEFDAKKRTRRLS